MGSGNSEKRSKILTTAFEKLSTATNLPEITILVAESARQLTNSDGSTFVLRDNQFCYYVDENALGPLWKGKRFPIETCISGWSMERQQAVLIPDIYHDKRIPHDAYRPTFVKSLCMIPIRVEKPLGAIGNYWSSGYLPNEEEIRSLQILANSTSIALENLELRLRLTVKESESQKHESRAHELELALHSMAHDLRTPVSGMTGLAEVLKLKLGPYADEKVREYLEDIMSTGKQTADQIESLLTLYRAQNGKIDKQKLNLTNMAQDLINVMRGEYADREIEFNVEPHLNAYADPSLLRVVVGNLLSNAIKFSSKKPRSRIEVGLHAAEPAQTVFFVRDNGEGFAPEKASELFKPLGRLESDFHGTGLGLASVAKIVELHGGKVRAEGRPSEGATFYFGLPHQAS